GDRGASIRVTGAQAGVRERTDSATLVPEAAVKAAIVEQPSLAKIKRNALVGAGTRTGCDDLVIRLSNQLRDGLVAVDSGLQLKRNRARGQAAVEGRIEATAVREHATDQPLRISRPATAEHDAAAAIEKNRTERRI